MTLYTWSAFSIVFIPASSCLRMPVSSALSHGDQEPEDLRGVEDFTRGDGPRAKRPAVLEQRS